MISSENINFKSSTPSMLSLICQDLTSNLSSICIASVNVVCGAMYLRILIITWTASRNGICRSTRHTLNNKIGLCILRSFLCCSLDSTNNWPRVLEAWKPYPPSIEQEIESYRKILGSYFDSTYFTFCNLELRSETSFQFICSSYFWSNLS